jgi:hypothetical protein
MRHRVLKSAYTSPGKITSKKRFTYFAKFIGGRAQLPL